MLRRVDLTFPLGFGSCYSHLCQVALPMSAACRQTSPTFDVYLLIIVLLQQLLLLTARLCLHIVRTSLNIATSCGPRKQLQVTGRHFIPMMVAIVYLMSLGITQKTRLRVSVKMLSEKINR